jgi:hypothetical protein
VGPPDAEIPKFGSPAVSDFAGFAPFCVFGALAVPDDASAEAVAVRAPEPESVAIEPSGETVAEEVGSGWGCASWFAAVSATFGLPPSEESDAAAVALFGCVAGFVWASVVASVASDPVAAF